MVVRICATNVPGGGLSVEIILPRMPRNKRGVATAHPLSLKLWQIPPPDIHVDAAAAKGEGNKSFDRYTYLP